MMMISLTIRLEFTEYHDCFIEEVIALPDNWYSLSELEQCDIIDREAAELEACYFKTKWEVKDERF